MVSQLANLNRFGPISLPLAAIGAFLVLFGCDLEQQEPASAAEGCQGPNCFDAGGGEQGSEATGPPTDELPDAPPAPEVEQVPAVCRGACEISSSKDCGPKIGDEQREQARYWNSAALATDAGALPDDGGVPGKPEGGGTLDEAGIGSLPDAGDGEKEKFSCQLSVKDDRLRASCQPAGDGTIGDSCTSSGDCGAGLGCVAIEGIGQCLPYCCGGDDDCKSGWFCAERPLHFGMTTSKATPGSESEYTAPVCAKAEQCRLGEAYPCAGEECSCKGEDSTCTVVMQDGTTGCVTPGDGQEGDSCPCDAGYFCSQGSNTCLKLCETAAHGMCGDLMCQPGPNFPDGWGLCVGLRESVRP